MIQPTDKHVRAVDKKYCTPTILLALEAAKLCSP